KIYKRITLESSSEPYLCGFVVLQVYVVLQCVTEGSHYFHSPAGEFVEILNFNERVLTVGDPITPPKQEHVNKCGLAVDCGFRHATDQTYIGEDIEAQIGLGVDEIIIHSRKAAIRRIQYFID